LGISAEWPFCVRPGGHHGDFYRDLWEKVDGKVEEEPFSGFAHLCAAWDDERTTDEDRIRFMERLEQQIAADRAATDGQAPDRLFVTVSCDTETALIRARNRTSPGRCGTANLGG
jgi:hypothetical protein